MPLEPIRVRGKKNTATKMSSAASSSSNPPAGPGGAGAEPKAPRKKARETDSSRRASILERLPVELLVMVFTESQNMDLLFCSRHLHAALNNHYSHVRLVAQAFAPTWSRYHGSPHREFVMKESDIGGPYDCVSYPSPDKGRHDIVCRQEQLIRKKFFTIDLVLDAQQVWYDTYRPKIRPVHFPYCGPNDQCDHCKGGVESHVINARECFEHDFRLAKASVNKKIEGWTEFRDRQDVEFGVELGLKILHGPWDENHEKLIFWLVAGGAYANNRRWEPEDSYDIVRSHTNVDSQGKVSINSFFTYGARELVNFRNWPLYDGYSFYLSLKPRPGSDDDWVPECRKFKDYLKNAFPDPEWHDRLAFRETRRAAGFDPEDSDLPYDPDNDSGDSDY